MALQTKFALKELSERSNYNPHLIKMTGYEGSETTSPIIKVGDFSFNFPVRIPRAETQLSLKGHILQKNGIDTTPIKGFFDELSDFRSRNGHLPQKQLDALVRAKAGEVKRRANAYVVKHLGSKFYHRLNKYQFKMFYVPFHPRLRGVFKYEHYPLFGTLCLTTEGDYLHLWKKKDYLNRLAERGDNYLYICAALCVTKDFFREAVGPEVSLMLDRNSMSRNRLLIKLAAHQVLPGYKSYSAWGSASDLSLDDMWSDEFNYLLRLALITYNALPSARLGTVGYPGLSTVREFNESFEGGGTSKEISGFVPVPF